MATRVAGIDRFRIDEIRTDLAKNVARKLSHCPEDCDLTVDVEIRNGQHSFMRCTTVRIGNTQTVAFRDDIRQRMIDAIDQSVRSELEALDADFHGSISVRLEVRKQVFDVREVTNKVTWQSR